MTRWISLSAPSRASPGDGSSTSTCLSGLSRCWSSARSCTCRSCRSGAPSTTLGAALLVAAIVSLLLVTVWGGQQYAWGSPQIIGLAIAGLALLGAFVLQERWAPEPVLPPRLTRCRLAAGNAGSGQSRAGASLQRLRRAR